MGTGNLSRNIFYRVWPWLIILATWLTLAGSVPASAQTEGDTLGLPVKPKNADDPSAFLSRLEVFNEFQHYEGGLNLNQTVIRNILKIGKKFTTRLDIPFVHNGFQSKGFDEFGLGDISFRLLGYKLLETRKAVFTASVEIQLNTAASPLLGTGKNIFLPVITYTDVLKGNRDLISVVLQQANSFGGDQERADLSFTKIQSIYLHFWTRRFWTVFADEFFIDYENGGTSMILKGRVIGAPTPRMNIWGQWNAGLYGQFVTRYQWGMEVGIRYLMLRSMSLNTSRRHKSKAE
jgi:hypothetical protein